MEEVAAVSEPNQKRSGRKRIRRFINDVNKKEEKSFGNAIVE